MQTAGGGKEEEEEGGASGEFNNFVFPSSSSSAAVGAPAAPTIFHFTFLSYLSSSIKGEETDTKTGCRFNLQHLRRRIFSTDIDKEN